jgi:hypothetical protein
MLAGCAAPQQPVATGRCAAEQGGPMLMFALFFGRSIQGQGEVGDRDWNEFLDQVVTPNLPSGYTVFDAAGAWRNPATGHTGHERTKVLLVALPDAAASTAAIDRVRKAYEAQYHQVLVGMSVAPTCGSF